VWCSPEVLVTPTKEHGKIIAALDSVKAKLYGEADIVNAIQIAQVRLLSPLF
jgi:hypothetical protein